ncbi:hypothetical protein GCM10018790_37320 [Kitasatospora xanthocidica]|uniref:DUF2269 domain-containing protein n=1 Tax=Kitasatospora xanthocidica TaxID=83382 RepID=UPI0019CC8B82|nr:DUF2269 domain-containing protein [Kitasatospora xanthocidica]GHF55933.1 hypothetical protein GCM10018790_37320 [Kitasatospora xanthocidica]
MRPSIGASDAAGVAGAVGAAGAADAVGAADAAGAVGAVATPGPAPGGRRRSADRRLPPGVRKPLVVLHVVASVSWLALMLCLLTLAVTALTTADADRLRAAYRAMGMLGDALVLPLSLLTFLSGVALGLGTSWGLFRYYWVSTKFWLTLAAMAASVFALTARLHDAVRVADVHPSGPIPVAELGFVRYNTVIVPAVALSLYLFNVALSVYKPWGRRGTATARRRRIPEAGGA